MQLQPDGAAWSIREEKEGLLTSYSITSSAGLSGFKCGQRLYINSFKIIQEIELSWIFYTHTHTHKTVGWQLFVQFAHHDLKTVESKNNL